MTLVGLKDQSGNISLFQYDDGEYTRYFELKFNQLTMNIVDMDKKLLPKGYKKYTIMLNEEEIEVYKFSKDSHYALVYGVDITTGEKELYQIDTKNNSAQIYNDELVKYMKDTDKNNLIIFAILGGVIFLEFLIILMFRSRKNKLLNKIKDKKIEKVKTKAINDAKNETVELKEEKKKKSE